MSEISGMAYAMESPDGADSWCRYQVQGDWTCVLVEDYNDLYVRANDPPTPGYVGPLVALLLFGAMVIGALIKRVSDAEFNSRCYRDGYERATFEKQMYADDLEEERAKVRRRKRK